MKKQITLFTIGLTATFGSIAHAQGMPAPMDFGPKENLVIQTKNGAKTFKVEVADTPAERTRGLMFRDVLANNEGMLFEFERPDIASIWMKNTSIFLDILFVRADGSILKIEHSAKPYSLRSMSSETPVVAVLEIPGGQTLEQGIKPGDIVKHPFFK